jgi:hypothetical protein
MNCNDLERNLALYLYDELTDEERAACDAHLTACEGCRGQLEETRRLHRLLNEWPAPEPSPELVARCRLGLDDALDREQLGWRSLLRGWMWTLGAAPASRAVALATLVFFGFGLGWTLRPRASRMPQPSSAGTPSSFLGADLSNLRISNISQVSPDPQSGDVHITMDAERRVTLEGSLDDPHIRQVLAYAVKSYDNPGIRRDTLDALRAQRNDPWVREALLFAMQHDANAGVRLEALKTVRGMKYGPDVHQALVDVLEHDTNPGVRVSAVDALLGHALESDDKSVLPVLKKLAASDQNLYVSLKCLAAARKLAGNTE